MNIVGVGAAFCMGCCPNIRNGAAIAAPAVWVSPPMSSSRFRWGWLPTSLPLYGCDILTDQPLSAPTSCADLHCQHGATCVTDAGGPRCVCESVVVGCVDGDKAGGGGATCGSDGQTYGSPCQLRLFACRMQQDIEVAHGGPCKGEFWGNTKDSMRNHSFVFVLYQLIPEISKRLWG